jgi:hypothetical protein
LGIRSRIRRLAQAALPVRASRRRIVHEIRFLRRNRRKRLVRPCPRVGPALNLRDSFQRIVSVRRLLVLGVGEPLL